MEILNISIFILTTIVCFFWTIGKKREIESTHVSFDKLDEPHSEKIKKDIMKDTDDLEYVSEIFNKISLIILKKTTGASLSFLICLSIGVWLLLEETIYEYAQAFWFFFGAFGQMLIGVILFQSLKIYDPKTIFISRISKSHATDYLINLNSYITMFNQLSNLVMFALVY